MKTIEQILADELAAQRADEEARTFDGFAVAELRQVMEGVQSPQGWKLPWAASVPHQLVGRVVAAVQYFHADRAVVVGAEPVTGKVLMRGNGYQC
jgi:hypothetical protein